MKLSQSPRELLAQQNMDFSVGSPQLLPTLHPKQVKSRLQIEIPRPLTLAVTSPERLLVYHAGTGKIVFIGLMKINTIFLFSFSCLVLAPSYYLAPDWPNWTVIAGNTTNTGCLTLGWLSSL